MSEMWNGVADAWERNAGFVDEHLATATDAMLDAAAIGEGDRVIELACGPGGAGLRAARRVGQSGAVTLADDAPAMVAAAERRAADLAWVTTAVFGQEAIAAPDDSADAVIIRHGLVFADDHAAAVAEAARVLRPGGRYAAMTWDRRSANPWLGLILDAVGEQFGVEFPPPNLPGPFALEDSAVLTGVLERGGLSDVSVEAIPAPQAMASLEAWWDRVPQLAGPLAVALQGMEPEVREQIRERARASGARAARPEDGGGIVLDGSVLVAAGTA